MDLIKKFEQMEACPEALNWIRSSGKTTFRELWDSCERPDWLLWLLIKETQRSYKIKRSLWGFSGYRTKWPSVKEILHCLIFMFKKEILPTAHKDFYPAFSVGLNQCYFRLTKNSFVRKEDVIEAKKAIIEYWLGKSAFSPHALMLLGLMDMVIGRDNLTASASARIFFDSEIYSKKPRCVNLCNFIRKYFKDYSFEVL